MDKRKLIKSSLMMLGLCVALMACNSGGAKASQNGAKSGDSSSVAAQKSAKPAGTDDAVDLGLSVKWAKCDLGAASPEKAGIYCGWADPTAKNTTTEVGENWDSPLYGGKNPAKSICGTNLDIATVKLGGTWRLPTCDEAIELCKKCKWTIETQNGVKGMKVTGPNGASIFLPAVGDKYDGEVRIDDFNSSEWGCNFWTGTLNEKRTEHAWYFGFDSGGPRYDTAVRYCGMQIRPVCK